MVTLINTLDGSLYRDICADFGNAPENLLEILHTVQHKEGFLSDFSLITIADALNISRAEIHGVVSFYHDYKTKAGPNTALKVCRAEACQAVGGEELAAYADKKYGEAEKHISVEPIYCLGNCALGPAVMVNETLYGRVFEARLDEIITKHLAEEVEATS